YVPPGHPYPSREPAEPLAVPAGGGRPAPRGGPGSGRGDATRPALSRPHRRADGRNLPERPDPRRTRTLPGRACRGSAVAVARRTAARVEPAAGAPEDRHAAAHRRTDHRLLALRRAARRPRPAASVLVPRPSRPASAATAVLDHAHAAQHARDHPLGPGS